jgi:hypothetical protein
MSYFSDASVTHEGKTFTFTAEEGRALENTGKYWHGPGDPSTWLAVAVFVRARDKFGDAPRSVALQLAAQALGITTDKLEGLIDWHVNYMRWHDGDWSYTV